MGTGITNSTAGGLQQHHHHQQAGRRNFASLPPSVFSAWLAAWRPTVRKSYGQSDSRVLRHRPYTPTARNRAHFPSCSQVDAWLIAWIGRETIMIYPCHDRAKAVGILRAFLDKVGVNSCVYLGMPCYPPPPSAAADTLPFSACTCVSPKHCFMRIPIRSPHRHGWVASLDYCGRSTSRRTAPTLRSSQSS